MRRLLPGLAAVLCATLLWGCSDDERFKDEIRAEVSAGRFKEAEAKARDRFAADKLNLMVMLEYIDVERSKREKDAYRQNLQFEKVHWKRTADGTALLSATLRNSGGKTLTGFGVKATLMVDGAARKSVSFSRTVTLPPGDCISFHHELSVPRFDQVHLELLDFGLDER